MAIFLLKVLKFIFRRQNSYTKNTIFLGLDLKNRLDDLQCATIFEAFKTKKAQPEIKNANELYKGIFR